MKRTVMASLAAFCLVISAGACEPRGDEIRKGTNSCYGSTTVCLDLDVFWNTQQCGGRQFVKETRLAYRWRQFDPQFSVRAIRGRIGYVSLVGCNGKLGAGAVRSFSRAAPTAGEWYQVDATSSFEYHTSVADYEASGGWVAGDVQRSSSKKGEICIQQLWRPNGGDACRAF